MDWTSFWANRTTNDSYSMTGFENWYSYEEYVNKIKDLSGILKTNISNEESVVNIGGGNGFLESLCDFGTWKSFDANKQACDESNGVVEHKVIHNPKEVLTKDSTLLMVSTSFYFREVYIYDAIRFCKKTILVDVTLQEDSLSMSTIGESHSTLSVSKLMLLGKQVTILPFSLVPFRKTVIIGE